MSFRLLWAGPWHAGAPAARLGAAIAASWAAAGHRVEIARTETDADLSRPPLPAPGPVHFARVMGPEITGGGYDAVFVVATDDPAQSLWAPWIMAHAPAILLLHDAQLGRLDAACRAAPGAPAGPGSRPADLAALMDMALAIVWRDAGGPGLAGAPGAAAGRCLGPVLRRPPPPPARSLPPPPPGPMALIASLCGAAAPEAARDMILALAALPALRARLGHLVLGPVPPAAQDRLTRLAARLGTAPPRFCPAPPDADALAALCAAQLICCHESADVAAALGLAAGRPVIHVAASAPPDGPALACPPGAPARLAHALQELDDDSALAATLAGRIRAHLAADDPAADDARHLLRFGMDAVGAMTVIQSSMRIRESLEALGLPAGGDALATARRGLAELLPPLNTGVHSA
jgi:hypothetical protein